jgi:hypothetical protein
MILNDSIQKKHKNTKEKHAKEKHAKEKHTKEKHTKEKHMKTPKNEKNLYKYLKNNIVRRWSNAFNGTYDLKTLMKSQIYSLFHHIYGFLICFVVIFSTNINYLLISILIVALDGISIIFLHQCPITMLERKYIGDSDSDLRERVMKKLDISYQCNHIYEQQIDFVINILFIITLKLFAILYMSTFNYKLNDDSMLYS